MARYEVKDVVCDYGIYEESELVLILNSRANALMIKEILEDDDKTGFPTKLFVPRNEVERLEKETEMLMREKTTLECVVSTARNQAKQEVARNIIADFRKMINGYENIDVYLDRIEKKYIIDKGE